MKCYISGDKFIRLPCLFIKLFKFEIQKCGQILCAHKPYFLMPGHICIYLRMHTHTYIPITFIVPSVLVVTGIE